jgi:DinB superfamily
MNTIALNLESLIEAYLPQLQMLSETEFSSKPSPTKWSKKEVIGHLIDSAQNNIRRFIVAQYEETPTILYKQDKWVTINDYQHQKLSNIIELWYLLNKQIVGILKNTSYETSQRISKSEELHTIQWLAQDYIKHLKHHVHVVLNLEPVSYP